MLTCPVRLQVLRSKLDKVDDTLSRMSETSDSAASDSVSLQTASLSLYLLRYLATCISFVRSPTATLPYYLTSLLPISSAPVSLSAPSTEVT